jgi:hypothetical protein
MFKGCPFHMIGGSILAIDFQSLYSIVNAFILANLHFQIKLLPKNYEKINFFKILN